MTTEEMTRRLRKKESIDLNEVAFRLYELKCVIDDMINDHYTDYLEWYVEKYWELTEENEKLKEVVANAINEGPGKSN